MDRLVDIALRDRQGAGEGGRESEPFAEKQSCILALDDGADELLVAWIDAKTPPCGVVTQGAGERSSQGERHDAGGGQCDRSAEGR